jgi:hypothetical protein
MTAEMSSVRRTVEEYTALLSRAFNGAIEVDGTRIVAHPSGTLLVRSTPAPQVVWPPAHLVATQRDNDWSEI